MSEFTMSVSAMPIEVDAKEEKKEEENGKKEIKENGHGLDDHASKEIEEAVEPYPRLYRVLEGGEEKFNGSHGEYIFRRLPEWLPQLTPEEIQSDLAEIQEAVAAKYSRRQKPALPRPAPVKPRAKPAARNIPLPTTTSIKKPVARKKKLEDEDKLVPLGAGPPVTASELIKAEYELEELEAQRSSLVDYARQCKDRADIDREHRLEFIRQLFIHADDEYTKMANAWQKTILLGELELAAKSRRKRRRQGAPLDTHTINDTEVFAIKDNLIDAFMKAYENTPEEDDDIESITEAQENATPPAAEAPSTAAATAATTAAAAAAVDIKNKIRTSARAQARAKQIEEERRRQEMKRIKLRLGREFYDPPTNVPLVLSPLSRRTDCVVAADYALIDHPGQFNQSRLNHPVLEQWEKMRFKALQLEGESRHLDYWMKQHLDMKRTTIEMLGKCQKGYTDAQDILNEVIEEYEDLVKERLDREANAAANEAHRRAAYDAVAAALTANQQPIPAYISLEEEEDNSSSRLKSNSDEDAPSSDDEDLDPALTSDIVKNDPMQLEDTPGSALSLPASVSKKRKVPSNDDVNNQEKDALPLGSNYKKSRHQENNNNNHL